MEAMAPLSATFVPTYQGLTASDFLRAPRPHAAEFPFDVPDRLPFYRARHAIYHLFRALVDRHPRLSVLVPDYNSGNEVLAIRAAGATVHYCHVGPDMQLDPDEVARLSAEHEVHLLYVIHYAGWPQPMPALVDLCRRRGILLVEDCALSLLSRPGGTPLGSFGDWSVFCLYKTLPLPHGALLVQNTNKIDSLRGLRLRTAGAASVAGQTAELVVQRLRGRVNSLGAALEFAKRRLGRLAGALQVRRELVGDMGFNTDDVDLAMSSLSARLLERMDFAEIRRRRAQNYRRLLTLLGPGVEPVFPSLPDGV